MARVFGRNAGLWTTGLIGAVTLGPLAVFSPTAAAFGAAALASLGAGTALVRTAGLSARYEKQSQEIDVLSKRLLKAEREAPARGTQDQQPADSLRAEVHELTVEIGLLSGIVRDLSAVIRSQDDEIAALKARPVAEPQAIPVNPVVQPPPSAPVPPAPRPAPVEPAPAERAWLPPALPAMPEPQANAQAGIPAGRYIPVRSQAFAQAPAPLLDEPAPLPVPRPIPPRPMAPPRGPDEATILTAFDREQLEVFLQPVVTLPQRKVVAYEALARIRIEEQVLEAAEYLPALERNGRTTELDRRMLARTGTIVRHLTRRGSDARVTYGLSPLSMFEPGFLKEIGRMAGDDQALAGLEIALPQASWRALDSGQLGLLAALRGRVGFCLDRPTDLRFDARELAEYGIGQVKVPAALLLRPAAARGALSDIAIEDLAPALARARIRLVVADVATEADVPDLIDLNVPFAQGAAFAPARPVRGEILSALPPEPPPPPQDDPGTERRSFRSLLRRAG